MFKLVQPNCFSAIAAAITEAVLRLPQHYRTAYVLARVEQEMRSAKSLCNRTWNARRSARRGIRDLFETLGIEASLEAAFTIEIRLERGRGLNLKRFLKRQTYATAHQAIHAIAKIDTVRAAVRRYQVAKQDDADARRLLNHVRAVFISLEACIDYSDRFRRQPPAGTLKGHIQRLEKNLPDLAWCFMAGSFKAGDGRAG